ncbi:rRNA methyltransferase mitochondrial, partial [Haematococcus lacustris]
MLFGEELLREVAGDTTRQPTTAFHTVFLVADPSSPVSPSWPAWVKAARRVLVSAGVMQKMMGVQSAGGVTLAAELDLPPPPDLQAWGCGQGRVPPHLTRLLVLDGVQDPGNLGSLARSALGFGFQALYLLPSCCDPWNDKAIRASQGAVLRIPIFRQGSLSHLLQVSSCCRAGPHLKARGVALVLGSEGQGLSKEVMQLFTALDEAAAGA